MKTVVIIGAGASGLACASTLSRSNQNIKIILLEQFTRSAKKLLATGNGRCNLSNKNMTIQAYNTQDKRIEKILQNFDAIEYFNAIGLLTRYDGDLLYPYSNQAATVKKVLLDSLRNVEHMEDCKVQNIIKKQSTYIIETNKKDYQADYVVYATGSKANRLSGEDNLQIMENLGLTINEVYPSLVQLQTKPVFPKLKGVRVKAKVSLVHKKEVIDTKEGEVLFTDTGVSGICVMQLSRWYHHYKKPLHIHIDMLPTYTKQEVEELFIQRKKKFHTSYLEGIFNEKLAEVFNKHQISPKEMILEIKDTNDYTKAQVMSGGVSLTEVDENLESLQYPNLFIVGEVLDVDGDCGGYNLHFAFASGNQVATVIDSKVRENVTD
ncbi:MAG: aminoacetone oxidase family FAD-binding enzyme [Coprobacillaceae bacterium]